MRVTVKRGLRLRKHYARQCKVEAQTWFWKFVNIVEIVCHRNVFVEASEADKLRLLNLRAWSRKYGVSEEFVIRTLVEYWSARKKKWEEQDGRRKKASTANTIGCKFATLCGKVSEEVLKAAITSEQVQGDKLAKQEHDVDLYNDIYMHTVSPIVQSDSPKEFVKKYRRMVNRARRSYDKVKTILSRRRYPNSPWY